MFIYLDFAVRYKSKIAALEKAYENDSGTTMEQQKGIRPLYAYFIIQYDIDLGDIYTIGGANLGWYDRNSMLTDAFSLYSSADGENYTKLADLSTGLYNDRGKTAVLFAQADCRYLRLVKGFNTPESFTKTDGLKCGWGYADYGIIDEFEIYGLANDSDGLVISNNALEKTIAGYNWSVSVRNHTGAEKMYSAFAACYDAEYNLIACIRSGMVKSDEFDYSKVINYYVHNSDVPAGTKYIKTFLWHGNIHRD